MCLNKRSVLLLLFMPTKQHVVTAVGATVCWSYEVYIYIYMYIEREMLV